MQTSQSSPCARSSLSTAALLAAGLLAACSVAAPPPSETDRPVATATPSGSPSREPVAADAVSHETGTRDVVLRLEEVGGFVPLGYRLTQAPTFTLYGDGTVIFRPLEDPDRPVPGGGLPPFLIGRMNQEQMQALLRFALGPGRLLDARERYENMMVADAPTTVFTVNAGGLQKQVSVYGLGIDSGQGADARELGGLFRLAEFLRNFEQEARHGAADEVAVYEPPEYRVMLAEVERGQQVAEPMAWPFPGVTLENFALDDELSARVALLNASLVSRVTRVPTGGVFDIPVEAPDGDDVYVMAVRPLLRDEEVSPLGN